MKILFLVSSMHRGGAERVAATLCNAWAQRGEDVTLVATYSGRGQLQYPLDDNIRFLYVADLIAGKSRKILGYASRVGALRQLIRHQTPDIVISFLANVNITATIATWGLDAPLIICERNDPSAATHEPAYTRFARRLLFPLADIVVAQTESVAAKMRMLVPNARRIEVIPNPIPQALLDAGELRSSAAPRRRLIAMGRLLPQKQMDHLIEVFCALAPQYPDIDLWIWGEGELRPNLERRIRETGLDGRAFLPGRTDSPWTEMARGDLFLLSSAYEGFPNVLLEAMALGLPCIAYDCPSGPRELSEHGRAAVLVPLNDQRGLLMAIATLLDDPGARQRLGTDAKISVRRRYSQNAVLAQWDQLIELARNNHRRVSLE